MQKKRQPKRPVANTSQVVDANRAIDPSAATAASPEKVKKAKGALEHFTEIIDQQWSRVASSKMSEEAIEQAVKRLALDLWISPARIFTALHDLDKPFHRHIKDRVEDPFEDGDDVLWMFSPGVAERIHAFDRVSAVADAVAGAWHQPIKALTEGLHPGAGSGIKRGDVWPTSSERSGYQNTLTLAAREFRKSSECYLSERGDIGPYMRWLLALRLVYQRWESICEFMAEPDAPDEKTSPDSLRGRLDRINKSFREGSALTLFGKSSAPEISRTDVERGFRFASGKHALQSSFYTDVGSWGTALLNGIRIIRHLDNVDDSIDLKEFLSKEVMGKEEHLGETVYRRFTNWLQFGWMPAKDDLSLLRTSVFLTTQRDGQPSRRRLQLDQILATLNCKDISGKIEQQYALTPDAPVLNLYVPRGWHATQAFVTRLVLDIEETRLSREEPISVVYVPLSRALTKATTMRTREIVSESLRKAFGLPSPPKDDQASDDFAQLLAIRTELTLRRTLVVIDGVELSADPFSRLFDVIKHTDWPTYLRALVQPDVGALIKTKREYQSRFIVLSSRPINDLKPWMPADPVPLEGVPDHGDAIQLLLRSRGDLKHEEVRGDLLRHGYWGMEETVAACKRAWPRSERGGPSRGPILKDENLSIATLYTLRDKTIERIKYLPDELDLTILWCAQEAGDDPTPAIDDDARSLSPETRIKVLKSFLRKRQSESPEECIALQLIALSLNGLRLTTLRRSLRSYAAMLEPEAAALKDKITEFVALLSTAKGEQPFLTRHFPLLVVGDDEDLAQVDPWQRWFEMQAFEEPVEPPSSSNGRELIDLRLLEFRELVLAELLDMSTVGGEAQRAKRIHFERLSTVLGEESLTQATAQLRRLPPGSDMNIYTLRRLLQAVYHGLMSCSFMDSEDLAHPRHLKVDTQSIPGSNFPSSPDKRYLFLYEFVFRKSIENAPQWKVSRGLARHDVRLCLLAMFLSPGWARRVLGSMYRREASERRFEDFGAFIPHHEFRNPFDPRAPHLRGVIGVDLFQAFLHCAMRTGRSEYVAKQSTSIADALARRSIGVASKAPANETTQQATQRLISIAMGALQSVEALHDDTTAVRPLKPDELERFIFAKMSIDAKLPIGELRSSAGEECKWWLRRLGCSDVERLLDLGHRFDVTTFDKVAFESDVLLPILKDIQEEVQSPHSILCLADLLSRYGELRVSEAEDQMSNEDPTKNEDPVTSIRSYASAYALYFLGDRLRSAAANMDRTSPIWPAISSRSSRFYVRSALKLAKEAAKAGSTADSVAAETLFANARRFFAHARGRTDVQTRHLWQLPAERLTVQLLLVSAARVWGKICAYRGEPREAKDGYGASLWYATEAEQVLASLGVPDTMAVRLHYERAKTLAMLAEFEQPIKRLQMRAMARRDVGIVEKLTKEGSRWRQRLQALRSDLKDDDPTPVLQVASG